MCVRPFCPSKTSQSTVMSDHGEDASDECSIADWTSSIDGDDGLAEGCGVLADVSTDVIPSGSSSITVSRIKHSNELASSIEATMADAIVNAPPDGASELNGEVTDEPIPLLTLQYKLLRNVLLSSHTHSFFDKAMTVPNGLRREALVRQYLANGCMPPDHCSFRPTNRDKVEFSRTVGCALERALAQFFQEGVTIDNLFAWGGKERPLFPGSTEQNSFAMYAAKDGLEVTIRTFMEWDLHTSVQTLPQQCDPGKPRKLNTCLAYGAQFFTPTGVRMLKIALERNKFHIYGGYDLVDPPEYV